MLLRWLMVMIIIPLLADWFYLGPFFFTARLLGWIR
jgi:hypothetical protein